MNRFVISVFIPIMFLIVVDAGFSPAYSEEGIKVEREKDKTVYTVGSGDNKNELTDRERSWEMLTNMSVIHEQEHKREHNGKGSDNNR